MNEARGDVPIRDCASKEKHEMAGGKRL